MSDEDEVPQVLAWLDVETSGLNPQEELLLEIGWRFTSLDFDTLHERKWQVYHGDELILRAYQAAPEVVRQMHNDNGLWAECQKRGQSVEEIETEMLKWFHAIGVDDMRLPISGSSVALDKAFFQHNMPEAFNIFHYRVMDNSTVKELCKRYNPVLYRQLHEKDVNHRVFSCLDASIAEAKFYAENFIFDGRDAPREWETK